MALMDDLRSRFSELVGIPEPELDLFAAAFHIARIEYPDVDETPYIDRLNEMADEVASRFPDGAGPYHRLEAINHHLYGDLGFSGNGEDYYDPRNSYLNDVMDRRTGIPITLSVVYREVARRAGLRMAGISMPGHFLLQCAGEDRAIFVDVFDRGIVLTRAECADRMKQIYGREAELSDAHLLPVGPRETLARILNNLRSIYIERSEWAKALAAVEWSQVVAPHDILLYREAGALAFQLGQLAKAEEAWDEYLRRVPDAPDAETIAAALITLRQTRHRVN